MILGNVGRVLANSRGQLKGIFTSWPWMILIKASETLRQHCDGVSNRVSLCWEKWDNREASGSFFHVSFRADLRKQQKLSSWENYIEKKKEKRNN